MTKDWIRNASDEELSAAIAEPQMVEHFVLMRAEVERRSLQKLLTASERLRETTLQLKSVSEVTANHIQRLADSSIIAEKLTDKLKTLTIWLIIFAGVQIAIAIVQTWKMFQPEPERPIRVVVQPAQSTSPQTPAIPAPLSRQ
jgi:hypothetical protein